jgi:two-component system alkaline phosphatase synthesis response regulator PhoP
MPDKNGYDLCYEIKHDENIALIPVVLFTAKAEWKIKMDELCKFVKANGYISKPFESQELLDKIKGLLEA